ncbi:MAG: ATP-binding cassette domain-containing protein [Clostridiales bacterium]|nr:ATP-binding cassette domain-containing protein [Clostridiales bacterium]
MRYVKRFYVRRFANNVNRRMKETLYGNLVRKGRRELEQEGGRLAGLDEAVGSLEQGLDTPCTPGIFSQGQWQLLFIARAVAADPKLLLLDEITANLDAETEHAVLLALRRASSNRMIISISHRTVADVGRLIPIGPAETA